MGDEQKSSSQLLQELFSTFNTTYDEDPGNVDADEDNSKKKKKKSKKSKKSKTKSKKGGGGGGGSSGSGSGGSEDESSSIQEVEESKKKGRKKSRDKNEEIQEDDKHRKKSKSKNGEEDVDNLIQRHRHKVKSQFRGLVSNIGDIVIKNDELIKSKSRKREDELRRAAGGQMDVEDGEILDEDKGDGTDPGGKKHKKKSKLSASQAYKLDMQEKMLLGLEPGRGKSSSRSASVKKESNHSQKHHQDRDKRHSLEEQESSSHHHQKDRRKSGGDGENHKSSRVVRQAPPRTPTPPRSRTPPPPRSSSPPTSASSGYLQSGRSVSYKETKWQKEQDHYESQQSYSRRRERDYDAGNYYEKETTRRSDGRSGFGFGDGGYYNDNGDRDRRSYHHDHHHQGHQHDDRRRGRSRSPTRPDRRTFRRSRSRSRSPQRRWRRSRSRSRSSERRRRHPDDIIDKAKLLEIARKNAAKLMRRGVLPSDIFSRDQIFAIRAGGKSVEELTDYCQRLAKKDASGIAISDDSGDDSGEEGHFLHHPFQVKDRPLPQITLNIRNAVPIPIRTPQALAIESAKLKGIFPVSSGTQHRIKELEWHPVDKDEEEKKKAAEDASKSLVPLDGPKVNAVSPMVREGPSDGTETAIATTESNKETEKTASTETEDGISLEHPIPVNFDISDVIAIRLKAMRQLSENPESEDAKKHLENATSMMKRWADSKALEPKFLTQSELTQGPQAWAKRDQLVKAKEVQSPMGLHLLQKMGWKPGEGLGKLKSGDTEPLSLEVKTDKKGLTSVLDYKKGPAMPVVFDLSAKHPISSLMELCAKRKWGAPDFDLVFEHGPAHKKQFVYKVIVNGVEYQPCVAVNNKKLAKANAAAFCLQSLGLLPTAPQPVSSENLQTVAPQPPQPVPPPVSFGFGPTRPGSIDNNTSNHRFTPAHYLQTVPTAAVQPSQPPLPPEMLMPPPPPPPPK